MIWRLARRLLLGRGAEADEPSSAAPRGPDVGQKQEPGQQPEAGQEQEAGKAAEESPYELPARPAEATSGTPPVVEAPAGSVPVEELRGEIPARDLPPQSRASSTTPAPRPASPAGVLAGSRLAHSLCIAGGKGGTGKSSLCAALAASLSRDRRVLVVDGDLGVGNAHLLHDVLPEATLVDVAAGRAGIRDALVSVHSGLDLLAGGSGYSEAASLAPFELARVARGVAELEEEYDWILVDSAAGLSRQTLDLARAADHMWLVSTTDVTAITDAYAFMKVLLGTDQKARPQLVLNRCRSEQEAREARDRIQAATVRFLDFELPCLALLPEDEAATRSLRLREPITRAARGSALAGEIEELVVRLLQSEGARSAPGSWSLRLAGMLGEQVRSGG